MNLKQLMTISLILFILTIGAASASQNQNMTDDSSLSTLDEAQQDAGNLSSSDSVVDVSQVKNDEEYNGDLVVIDNINANNPEDYIAYVYDRDYVSGTVSATFDGSNVFNRQYTAENRNSIVGLCVGDLNEAPTLGIHDMTLTYQKNGVVENYTVSKKVNLTYTFNIWLDEDDWEYTEYGFEAPLVFVMPKDATGFLNLELDGKTYKVRVDGEYTYFSLEDLKLKVGVYYLKATYNDPTGKYPKKTVTKKIIIQPHVSFPSEMSIGEKESIIIKSHENSKITAVLYKIDHDKKTKIKSYSGTTLLDIPLDEIAKKGFNNFYLKINCEKYTSHQYVPIDVYKNYAKFKVSVTKKKDSATIVINGPKLDSGMNIYLDNHHLFNINFKKGHVKKILSSLPVGKHHIKIGYDDGVRFYSNSFYVTVKKADKVSLVLKKVKVKKSAKRVVLKAQIRYKKKLVVNKLVLFKFNGKKYVVKTNKKGVAKVKIKKPILKKLNVGEKVRYQVTYFKATAERVAKVTW